MAFAPNARERAALNAEADAMSDGPCGLAPCSKWPVAIKGKLYWKRTWDYNDDKKAITAIKEYLPGAKAVLWIKAKGATAFTEHATVNVTDGAKKALDSPHTDTGEFAFKDIPEFEALRLAVHLEYKDAKIVVMKGVTIAGKSKYIDETDLQVHNGKVVWNRFDLDTAAIDGSKAEYDLGDVEIKEARFVELCDAYKSVWVGHKRIFELAAYDLPVCQINFPEDDALTVSNAGAQMNLCKGDVKDRDVILHEYGHFIGDHILGSPSHPGYGYNDDPDLQHSPTSKEHYEASWSEGFATFLSCFLQDDPHYHDGYDTTLDMHLDSDNTTVGPHCEGSVQEALWRIHKVHKVDFKAGFWKAFSDRTTRTVETIYDFYLNWKDLACPELAKLVESYKKFGMQYCYLYKSGADRFTKVVAPKKFDLTAKQFAAYAELFTNFGKLGSGTAVDYNEEFYNRNKHFNRGSLAAGSTIAAPKVKNGAAYIVPERVEVKV